MAKPISMRVQLAVLAVIVGAGSFAWVQREEVAKAAAAFLSPGAEVKDGTGADRRRGRGGGGRPVPVIVAKVEQDRDDETVTAVGTGRAKRSIMVFAKTEGEIVALGVKSGDRVASNDVLFSVDPTKAKLAVDIAKKQLEEARRLLDRSQYLERRNVQSNARAEDAQTAVERAELQLRQAEEELADTTVRAPFDAIAGIPKVERGDRVTSTTQVITLDDRSELYIEFQVPEKLMARVDVGDAVTASTPSHPRREFTGTISAIDSRIDATSRTVTVRASLPNGEDLLRPGMSFTVELKLPGDVFTSVPELAVQWRKGESFVWLARDGKAERVVVETVKRRNSTILVSGPLTVGDRIVVEGVQRLRPGVALDFRSDDATPTVAPRDGTSSGEGNGQRRRDRQNGQEPVSARATSRDRG